MAEVEQYDLPVVIDLDAYEFEVNVVSKLRCLSGLVTCSLMFIGGVWMALGLALDWDNVKQEEAGTETLMILFALCLALLGLWQALLAAWRLRGPHFDARVYPEGLMLHPSLVLKIIPWKNIKRSRVLKTQGNDGRGYWHNRLDLELIEPVWSLGCPVPTTKLSLNSPRKWGHNPEMAELGRRVRAHRLKSGWKR